MVNTGSVSATFINAGDIGKAGSFQAHTHILLNEFISAGSLTAVIGSASTHQDIGSIVIGAGSLAYPCVLKMNYTMDNSNMSPSFWVSGLSNVGSVFFPNVGGNAVSQLTGEFTAFLGSPLQGHLTLSGFGQGIDLAAGSMHNSGQIFNNFDTTGSAVVILRMINANSTGSRFITYQLYQRRGS